MHAKQCREFATIAASCSKREMARTRCELSLETCKLLLKSHVDSLDDRKYNDDDYDNVVKRYVGFLSACAQHTERLNSTIVQSAATSVLGASPSVAKKFADAMAHALSYCYSKGSKATSGKKLPECVRSVIVSFKTTKVGLASLQTRLKSPDDAEKKGEHIIADAEVAAPSGHAAAAGDVLTSGKAIRDLYGFSSPPKKQKVPLDELMFVCSSQEVMSDTDAEATVQNQS